MTTNQPYLGYIGTYTKGDSKGIYSFKLDPNQAKIIDVNLAAELGNPTYLNLSNDNNYLYAVVKKGEEGGVSGFSIDSSTGELTPINSQFLPGASPCHVSLDSSRRILFSANYHKGSVESYLLNTDGSIEPPSSDIKHEGSGPDPRQDKPHTHFAGVTPDEKYLAVVELGTDCLISYEINKDNGQIVEISRLPLKGGSGPRHITFHPMKDIAYIMTEFSSEVIVLTYHPENGHFSERQYISTIPEDFKENNQGSAIHISSDGRFVYAGNRGHNSIAILNVDEETGGLTFVDRVSSEGDWPRDFAFDPSEQFLIGSNQESHNLVLYKRDKETGKLTVLQSDITVPYPVCVKFLHY